MSRVRWSFLVALVPLLLGAPSSAQAEDAAERIDARSAYLMESLLNGHQIHLRGELGGTGQLRVDPNACRTNEFGDPTRCTRRAPMTYEVALQHVKLADPSQRGRRLYTVKGGALPAGLRISLVVPGRAGTPPRLILTDGNMRQIITMVAPAPVTPTPIEPTPPIEPGPSVEPQPPEPPTPEPLVPGKIEYKAYQRGQLVTLEVRGSHTTAGYTTTLDRLPGTDGVPHYRLLQKPPTGPAAQVITPFSIIRTFQSKTPLEKLRVTDGSGTHVVKLEQR